MRDRYTIGSELPLLAAVQRAEAQDGAVPSVVPVDALLDERALRSRDRAWT